MKRVVVEICKTVKGGCDTKTEGLSRGIESEEILGAIGHNRKIDSNAVIDRIEPDSLQLARQ